MWPLPEPGLFLLIYYFIYFIFISDISTELPGKMLSWMKQYAIKCKPCYFNLNGSLVWSILISAYKNHPTCLKSAETEPNRLFPLKKNLLSLYFVFVLIPFLTSHLYVTVSVNNQTPPPLLCKCFSVVCKLPGHQMLSAKCLQSTECHPREPFPVCLQTLSLVSFKLLTSPKWQRWALRSKEFYVLCFVKLKFRTLSMLL